jgi:hypothetical protein
MECACPKEARPQDWGNTRMTFADLVTADMNFRHQERIREGKAYKPEDMPEWERSICNVLEKIRFIPAGVSGLPLDTLPTGRPGRPRRLEPLDLEPTTLNEVLRNL